MNEPALKLVQRLDHESIGDAMPPKQERLSVQIVTHIRECYEQPAPSRRVSVARDLRIIAQKVDNLQMEVQTLRDAVTLLSSHITGGIEAVNTVRAISADIAKRAAKL